MLRIIHSKNIGFELFLFAVLTVFLTGCQNKTELPSFGGFSLTKDYMDSENTINLIYFGNQNTIRLKVIPDLDKTSAEEIIGFSSLTMKSLYDTTSSAYPGQVSSEIVCDSRFIPEQMHTNHNGRDITYFTAYLSERLIYGACAEDLAPYKGVIAWSYCRNKRELRQFEFISKKELFADSNIDFVKKNICN